MRRNVIAERAGASLRRSPYVWLVATILSFLVLLSGLAPIAESPGSANTAIAILAAGLILYGIGVWAMLPRLLAKSRKAAPSDDTKAATLWMLAANPFVAAWACVAAGGEQWAVGIGFVASVALLVISARRMAHGRVV